MWNSRSSTRGPPATRSISLAKAGPTPRSPRQGREQREERIIRDLTGGVGWRHGRANFMGSARYMTAHRQGPKSAADRHRL